MVPVFCLTGISFLFMSLMVVAILVLHFFLLKNEIHEICFYYSHYFNSVWLWSQNVKVNYFSNSTELMLKADCLSVQLSFYAQYIYIYILISYSIWKIKMLYILAIQLIYNTNRCWIKYQFVNYLFAGNSGLSAGRQSDPPCIDKMSLPVPFLHPLVDNPRWTLTDLATAILFMMAG